MASHRGGNSPPETAVVGRGRGAIGRGGMVTTPTAVGRGAKLSACFRGRGILISPRSPGSQRVGPPSAPSVSAAAAAEVSDDNPPLCVKVRISSLASDVDVNDIKKHFTNFCEFACKGDVTVSSAVILGGGKADLVLNGLTNSDIQELCSETHKIKGAQIVTEFEEPIPASEGLTVGEGRPLSIEVRNVPRVVSTDALKVFFESDRSGGSDGAVANIRNIDEGVFRVTFQNQNVAAKVMSEPRTVKSSVITMKVLEEDKVDMVEMDEEAEEEEAVIAANEPEFNQIVVRNFPDGKSERVVKTYFETSKANSHKGAVSDCVKLERGVFLVTFHDPKVAENVLSKQEHKYSKSTLKLERQVGGTSGTFNQIEVQYVPEGTSERTLKTYFETSMANSSKGAVSNCKQVGKGAFVVTFHNPKVAENVLSKQPHQYKETTLRLNRLDQLKYRQDQLLVRGLGKDVEKEEYELIVADCTKIPMREVNVCINDDSSAIITFMNTHSIEELQDIAKKLADRDAGVEVELVKDVKPSVHVLNVSASVFDEDLLKVYFSKQEKSGGGEVELVEIPNDGEAIITFADPQVIQRVMKKDHTVFLGPSAVINVFGNNTSVQPESAQASIAPEPLEFTLDPLLIQSINQNPSPLEQSILSSQVQFSADEDKGLLVFSPTGKAQSSWRQDCKKLVPQYLAHLTKQTMSIPMGATSEAKEVLMSLSKDNPSIRFNWNTEETEITIAGEDSCVEDARKAINNLCSDLTTKCSESIMLGPEDFAFVEQVKQHDFPAGITSSFDPDMFTMTISGPKAVVMKIKTTIKDITNHAKVPVSLSPIVIEFFNTPIGRGKLEEVLKKLKCHVALCFTQSYTLLLYFLADLKDEAEVKLLAEQLQHMVASQALVIPDAIVSIVIDSEEFTQLCQNNGKKYEVLVKHVGPEVTITGFNKYIKPCEDAIRGFFKQKSAPPAPIEVDVGNLAARSISQNALGLEKCLMTFDAKVRCETERGIVQIVPSHYLNPGWEEECRKIVNEFKNDKIFERSMMVPEKASSEIIAVLLSAQQSDKAFVHVRSSSTSISFAGYPRTVIDTEEKVKQICSIHEYKHEELSLNAEMFEFVNKVKLQSMKIKFHGVDLKLLPQTSSIGVSGPAKEVAEVKEKVLSLKAKIILVSVPVEEPILHYLISGKGKDLLFNLFLENKCNKCIAYSHHSPARLMVICTQKHRNSAEKMKKMIVDRTISKSLDVSKCLQPFLHELPEFTSMMTSLEKEEKSAMVAMEGDVIIVAGFKGGVSKITKMISELFNVKVDHFKPFQVPIDRMMGLCLQDNMESLDSWALSINVTCGLEFGKKGETKVILSPTKHTKPKWKDSCKQLFLSYVETEFPCVAVEFPDEVKHDVMDLLLSRNKVIKFDMNADSPVVTITGDKSAVEKVLNRIDDIQNEKQITKTKQMSLKEYDVFTQLVLNTLPVEVAFELLPEKHSVKFTGCVSDVFSTLKSVEEALVHSDVTINATEVEVRFIHGEGREQLRCLLQENNIKAAIHCKISVKLPILQLLCDNQSVQGVKQFCQNFKKHLSTSIVPLLSKTITKPPLSLKLDRYCQQLSTEHCVLIEIRHEGVRICGFNKAAKAVEKLIFDFISDNCIISQVFNMEKGKARLVSSHMQGRWDKFVSSYSGKVSITLPVDSAKVNLKGDISEVERVMNDLESLVKSIHTANIPLETVQVYQYFQDSGEGALQLPGIEKSASVIIEVCAVVDSMEVAKTTTPRSMHKVMKRQLSEECTAVVDDKRIRLYRGDITEFRADVIVNAANEDLHHIGGLAYAIVQKGGKEIQDSSNHYMSGRGKLKVGDVWLSKSVGKLPCQAIIHAVGPRWQRNKSGREQLRKVCINCLTEASSYKSIALPAISTGVFGCPMGQCADVMVSAAVEFCNAQKSVPLNEINIVLFNQPDVAFFVRAVKAHIPLHNVRCAKTFKLSPASLRSLRGKPKLPAKEVKTEHSEASSKPGSTIALDRVHIKEGSLLDIQAEIYVNSTNGNLDLSGGAVAKAIAKAAGPELQTECTKKAPIGAGEIAVTGAGTITGCKCIIHVNCPEYAAGGQAEQMLKSIMKKCMEECCEKQAASSIVFPAIGTGILKFPADTTAQIMVGEIYSYLQQNECDSLKSASIMIYKDRTMYQTFCDELESQKKEETVVTKAVSMLEGKSTTTSVTEVPMKKVPVLPPHPVPVLPSAVAAAVDKSGSDQCVLNFDNGLSMEIIKGDITIENVDVIVNTTAEGMILDGGVSLALAKRAGKKLQEACNAVPSAEKKSLKDGKVIVTESGDLKCTNVFHVKFQKHNFVTVVSACIEKARELQYSSISFPAIGTGRENYPADAAARDMIKGMETCAAASKVHVRVVLFEEKVYRKFVEVVENHLVQPAPVVAKPVVEASAMPLPTPSNLQPKKDEFEIKIFGETQKCVKSAESKITEIIKMQFKKDKISEDKITSLNESQLRILRREAENMQLKFSVDVSSKTIELEGKKDAIYEMKLKIKDELSKAERGETLMKKVQWKRQDSTAEPSYDPLINMEIEEHREKSTYTVKDDLSGEHFTIDFKNMTEIDHNMEDRVRKIIREEISTELPEYWAPMKKGVSLHLVDLKTTSKEYVFVLGEFNKTMKQGSKYSTIFQIQRIQNPSLYKQLVAKKKQLDSQNPPDVENERWLFHGTKQASIASINRTNFNRNFRGQNATAYGQGCYFARDASFSNGYAPVDGQGRKYMYLVRVLTGQYTRGNTAMLVPPAKDLSDQSVLFESVVDHPTNPTIFVVFYDADAYPEYLITYR